ncbi:MAG TPA: ADOP family duplicated permease [Gemmatimonadaceae bacterium]|nr:ADOP family duplicated permease [Gemmatimonadaceae bacterium]
MPPSSRSSRPPTWRRYLRFLGPDVEADIDDELAFHLAERVEALRAAGKSEGAARAQALAEFGDVSDVRRSLQAIDRRMEQRRDRLGRAIDALAQLRHSVRFLVRQPSFTVPAVVTLALGLAATVAIFTLLDAIVLRPLPFPNADRLVALSSPMPKLNDTWGIARHQLFYYKANARSIEEMGLYTSGEVTLTGDGSTSFAERVRSATVTAGIFDVLGIVPAMGRVLTAQDNLPRESSVVVLGHDLWMRRFGGDPAIVGKRVALEGFLYEVVGVVAAGAQLPDRPVDLWLPDWADPAAEAQNNHVRQAVARLRPGYGAASAEADLAPWVLRMEEAFPSAYPNHWIRDSGFRTAVVPLREAVVGATIARALWVLLAGVSLVLVVALANVANLFLVRGDGRAREVLVRSALGARRGDLLALHLTDALVVTTAAALLAMALVRGGIGALAWLSPGGLPRLAEVHAGWGTLAILLALSLAIGLGLGVATAGAARGDHAALRDGSRGLTLSRRQVAVRGVLVVAQVAMAVVLLAGAGLMVRSFDKLRRISPGFAADGVATMELSLPAARYDGPARVSAFYEQVAQAVRGLPGVTEASVVEQLPLTGRSGCTGVVTSQPGARGRRESCVSTVQVAPGYFAAMRIPVRGRESTWGEVHQGGGGAIVTRAVAEVLWPGEDPIGRTIRCCSVDSGWFRVTGVTDGLYDEGLDAPPMQAVFFSLEPPPGADLQWLARQTSLVIRAPSRTPAQLYPLVQRAVARLDPQVPVTNARALGAVVADSMARRTFTLVLLAAAAAIALLLSAIGLYAVVSYVVSHRVGEIGIRMALGARASQVAQLVVRQAIGLTLLGVAVGVVGALATTRVLGTLLYEVAPTDPMVLGGVAVVLLVIAVAASLAPTWRAVRVEPASALRAE